MERIRIFRERALESQSALCFGPQASQRKMGRARGGAHPRRGCPEDEVGWPGGPGRLGPIVRTFKDGHTEKWWAVEVITLVGYGPEKSIRLVAVTTDPE